jgi:hypothetical protein
VQNEAFRDFNFEMMGERKMLPPFQLLNHSRIYGFVAVPEDIR